MFIEILAPPFLAVLWMCVASRNSQTISEILLGFGPALIFAYAFGIFPALLYTCAMEFWFESGLRARFGLLCTAGLSAFMGAAAGFLSAAIGTLVGFLLRPDCLYFLRVGAFVGLLIGFLVGRQQKCNKPLQATLATSGIAPGNGD